ncbi:polyhomeotic, putative [Pediculus humanus corporis]|uniref:Polyhomeotic, putative n=1 Tax=Pediculus humanus subsp. corporis TaxID=121224 RepID=E0VRB8_PEDHC|nr:polyhomeotic, putative [Pediculus humanus corporis]EEB15924.1 polyhomeotic, putative [Pediculus humanus corporis]
MNDNKQQQNAQQQQQAPQQQQAQIQRQQVENQIQVQQVQISQDGSDQMHPQGNRVASSNATMNPTSTMVMAAQQTILPQQAMQNLQSPPTIAPMPTQSGCTTITTMSTGPPQQMADWPGHGRVQVIQQPIQNPTYIQPVYNTQGQLIMPGNIALHPANMNQPIQVIAAGKAFQSGQMPHMLTTAQGKQLVQGQTTSFPGYATIPTSGNNQTLVISQLGVLGQTNILSQQQGKPQEMQKMITKSNNNNAKQTTNQQQNVSIGSLVSSQPQGITTQAQTIIQPQILSPIQYTQQQRGVPQVPQGSTQAMQFAPWQATFGPTGLPQGLAWAPGAIQSSALLAQGSQIFIRNPQHEQTGMFIQNTQPSSIPQHNQIAGQQINNEAVGNVQPKTAIPKTFSTILPSSIGQQNIRPASVSTQTGQTQTTVHQATYQSQKAQGTKVRTKNVYRMPSMATSQKSDAANQTKSSAGQVLQPKIVVSNVGQDKIIKSFQNQIPEQQQGVPPQQQPLNQIEQMQNMLHQPMEQKTPSGQIILSNNMQNPADRNVMPVVSMPPGQMGPVMGNMIVQAVPGITTMASGLALSAGQQVQGVPIAQQVLPTQQNLKQEGTENKTDGTGGPETASSGRPNDDNTSGSEESSAATGVNVAAGVAAAAAAAAAASGTAPAAEVKVEKTGGTLEAGSNNVASGEDKENEKKTNDKDSLGGVQPKAMVVVKPQVLTHVIDGFVIQESSEPFPVNRGCMDGLLKKLNEDGEPPMKKSLLGNNNESGKFKKLATCETCGKKDLKAKFKKSKRFCSMSCAKRFNVSGSSRVDLIAKEEIKADADGDMMNESVDESSSSPEEESKENANFTNEDGDKVNPLQWTVADVCEFIRNLPGCADYVEDFAMQDIDGEALMLLKPDHLMSVMSMKLGPAVKIIAKIDAIKNENNPVQPKQ